jgi:very-short-patch-repair endonuclease
VTRLTDAELKMLKENPDVVIVEEPRQSRTEARQQLDRALRGRLSETFLAHWQRNELPALTPEYQFHPERRWRFDYALPEQRIAVEVEGGTWQNGRHNRAKGYAKDAEKYNAAQGLGWTVFRFSDVMIREGQEAMDAYLKPIKERIGQ